ASPDTRSPRPLWTGPSSCRSGGRRLEYRCGDFLGRHQDPQDRVDDQLATRNGKQDQNEQQPGRPGVEPEPATQPGTHPAEDPVAVRPHQPLAPHRLVDGFHLSHLLLVVTHRASLHETPTASGPDPVRTRRVQPRTASGSVASGGGSAMSRVFTMECGPPMAGLCTWRGT